MKALKDLFLSDVNHNHKEIIRRLDRVIDLLERPAASQAASVAKDYYTNADLCRMLRVSKRTLARYRQKGLISYYMIGRKTYYKVSDVENFLHGKAKFSK